MRPMRSSLWVALALASVQLACSSAPPPKSGRSPRNPPPSSAGGSGYSGGGKCASWSRERLGSAAKGCLNGSAGECGLICDCATGDRAQAPACFEAGSRHHKASNKTAALPYFQRSCEMKIQEGCFNAGLMLTKGEGTAKNYPQAKRMYELGCAGGMLAACNNLGVLYSTGKEGVPENDKEARALFTKGCGGNEPLSCGNLANMLFKGEGGPRDDKQAVQLFEKACKADNARACGMLGLAHVDGLGGYPRDPAKGLAMLNASCAKDIAESCGQLAGLYADGVGAAPDINRAVQLHQKACQGGHSPSCTSLATSAKLGATAEAPKWHELGCRLGERKSCIDLARLARGASPPDEKRALEFFDLACTEGSAEGCHEAAALVKDRAEQAAAYEKKACELEQKPSCP